MSHVCDRQEPHASHYHGYGRLCEGRPARDLRCSGCGRRVATTTRMQAVPVQCTDPLCQTSPPISKNEERDSIIEYLAIVEQRTPEQLGQLFGMSRQGIARIMASR